ncbi:hypothetical protein [Planococcus beigongshangi]|uniref:hypothetical protein n=1 Tax=Planococcus beigongshangi TaxID=2782536 RepID=UPI00193B48FB|nr:hypothetical protein [Planococcus beigongshangi]
MWKKIVAAVTLILVVAALIVAAFVFLKNETQVYASEKFSVSVTVPLFMKVEEAEITERSIENVIDIIHTRKLSLLGFDIGAFELTERTLGNGSQFIFERVINESFIPLPLVTAVQELGEINHKDWNPVVVEHEYHKDFGTDPTVNPFGKIEFEGGDILQGNVYISTQMIEEYENGDSSYVRELQEEVRELELKDDSIEKSFWLKKDEIAESWLLVSEEDLFDSAEVEDDWIDFALHNQTQQLNWLTSDGPFTKLPHSLEPYTPMGYGRAIGRFEDNISLRWNADTPSVFFESMILNSRANLINYFEEYDGTRWPTEYTSTWLKDSYGITATYVDTRFNEYVAFYLDQTAELYDADIDQEDFAVEIYADYLLSRIEVGETIEAGEGFLIVDYFDEDPETPITHASLNHELGCLKILLAAYGNTEDDKYLNAASNIVQGIEYLGEQDGGWIRESGDLWYQVNPDGTFEGNDYPHLTLIDLLETQELFEELGMEQNNYFNELIDSKLGYIEAVDIQLNDKAIELLNNRNISYSEAS